MEAYLTMGDLMEIRSLMHTLNGFKTGRYGLEVLVTDKTNGSPIGSLKQTSKNSEFVFVPAAAYQPYKPTTGKGE